jgi:DNA polymerase-1
MVNWLKERIGRQGYAAIDTETDGLDISRSRVRFWSLAVDLNSRFFLEDTMLEEFKHVFNDPKISWIGTHTKFDAHMLNNSGYYLKGDLLCTLVMDRLYEPSYSHGLKESYEREFNENMATLEKSFYPRNKETGKPYKPKNKSILEIMEEQWEQNPNAVVEYASLDAWASLRLFFHLKKNLEEMVTHTGNSLWDIYLDYEVPLTKILLDCEIRGAEIDVEFLESLGPKILEERELACKKLNHLAGQITNPNSPKQLQELFFKKLGIQPTEFTSGGKSGNKQPSVAEAVLEKLATAGVQEAQIVLRARKLTKIYGTYVSGILERLGPDGRLHGSLNQHVAATGRLTGSEPNLQLEVVKSRELLETPKDSIATTKSETIIVNA